MTEENITHFPKAQHNLAQQELTQCAQALSQLHLTELFSENNTRFQDFSLRFEQLFLDYSKQRIDLPIVQQLIRLAEQQQLKAWIQALFSEKTINYTEQRAAMHWALRLPEQSVEFPELAEQVQQQLQRMYALVEKSMRGNIVVQQVKSYKML